MLTEPAPLLPDGIAATMPVSATAEVTVDKPHAHLHTNSVNRSYSDLDNRSFLLYAFALCVARTAAQQPTNLALARKQTCSYHNGLSTAGVLRRVYRHEGGLRGLSQGMVAMTLGCALSEVIYLFIFEYGRERVPLHSSAGRDAVAGYGADAACRLVHVPMTIVAFRQMTATCGPRLGTASASIARKGSWATLCGMYGENGVRTVFAGLGTTLLVGCQWSALWWALYGVFKTSLYSAAAPLLAPEKVAASAHDSQPVGGAACRWLRSALPHWALTQDDNFFVNSVASVAAGSTTAVLFNPYLVIRTNLQTTPMATLRSVTCGIYRERGVRGFYSGLWLSVLTCVADGVLASTSYEYAKLWSDRSRSYEARAAGSDKHRHSGEWERTVAAEYSLF